MSYLAESHLENFLFEFAAKEKLEIVKSRGEAAPNFLGKNAFGLIQEYGTIELPNCSGFKH